MNSVERVKAICKERGIAISRLEKDLGFSNGYIGQLKKGIFPADRLKQISDYLNVTIEYLMTGQEESKEKSPELSARDERDISRRLEQTLADLEAQQGALMFDGAPLDDETKELLKVSLEHSIRVAKINAKKFTNKRYLNSDNQGK